MEGIKIYKKPRLKSPYLIVAWPGMGEVAYKCAMYLVDKLQAEEFAEIMPQGLFYLTASVIKEGILDIPDLPYSKLYYWKNKTGKNDIVILLSNAQPDLGKAEEYVERIIYIAKTFKIKIIICFAAMPQPIDHMQSPGVWFTATSKELINELKKYNLTLLLEGQISGMNGLFLGFAKKEGLSGFCLLGEIPLYTIQIENPKASYAALKALSRILNIRIDFTDLVAQAHTLENEINRLLDYLKIEVGGGTVAPIGEEDIERIKKSLSEFSRLPLSVKEKIEKLFAQARADISKANELKVELDKWNVYKEYEDRFLDLFKKKKDKDN